MKWFKRKTEQGKGISCSPLMTKKRSIVLMFLFVLIFFVALRACGKSNLESSMENLEKGIVKIDIQGYQFNVPLRYMYDKYGEAMKEERRWPKPKKERLKKWHLGIDVLLLDMKPYYPEDKQRWIVSGYGDKAHISISYWEDEKKSPWQMRIEIDAQESRLYKKETDIYGLVHYAPIGITSSDKYYAADGRKLRIACDSPQEVCTVSSYYNSDLYLEYTYSIRYLPHWREIDDKVKALFDQFQHAAQTESNS